MRGIDWKSNILFANRGEDDSRIFERGKANSKDTISFDIVRSKCEILVYFDTHTDTIISFVCFVHRGCDILVLRIVCFV